MPSKHYKYGGSSATRTLACPAWQIKREALPKALTSDTGNIFADRGTLLHDAMEAYILGDLPDPYDWVGKKLNEAEITEEDVRDSLIPAREALEDFLKSRDVYVHHILPEIECYIDKDIGGTCDVLAWNDDTVFIIDHKFGFNHVSAEESAQGLFYAMCANEDAEDRYADIFTPERINLVIGILQPANANIGLPIMEVWETDMNHLTEFADKFFISIDNATEEDLHSGEHCKYCPVSSVCPAKTGLARKALMLDKNDMEQLSDGMAMVSELEAWCKDVRALAHNQADMGNKVRGYKLVAKRATRKWNDTDAVMDKVRKARKIKLEQAVDMKLLSPPKFEKVCAKLGVDFDAYADYISAISSGSSLVTEDDKRPELLSVQALGSAIASIA